MAAGIMASCSTPSNQSEEEHLSAAELISRRDYASAMITASTELEQTTDSVESAGRLMIISECHAAAGNYPAALSYATAASEMAPAHIPVKRFLVDMATRAGEYELALAKVSEIGAIDSTELLVSLSQTVTPALALGQTDVAASALRALLAKSVWLEPTQRVALAEIFQSDGRADSATMILEGIGLPNLSDPQALNALAHYYENHAYPATALTVYRRLAFIQDSLLQNAEASGIYGKLYDYEHSMRIRQDADAQVRDTRLRLVIFATLAALIAAMALALYYRARGKRKQLELQNDLLIAAEELRQQSERQRSVITRLFRDSYESVEMAVNLLIDGSAAKSSEVVMRQLRSKVDECRTPEFLSRLEDAVNECHADIITRLRADIPLLSESEITVALYCAAGLSSRVICLMLDCTPAALYNKKYRLKRKIQQANLSETDRNEYLKLIDTQP